MGSGKHIGIALALAICLALGAYQGVRLNRMRHSETFYRWLVNAGSLMRLEGTLEYESSESTAEVLDDQLYREVEAEAELRLPAYPESGEDDYDEDGKLYSKLIRAVRQKKDDDLYALASSAESERIKTKFFEYLDGGNLQSVGIQFTTAALYAEGTQVAGVGVSSLFFGFRKLAANFIWLQVDKFWHLGQLHRMVPLMRTCVALDPTFVDAYLLGSWHLAYNIPAKLPLTPEPQKQWHPKYGKRLGHREEWYYVGIDFLKDGIRKNPRDYRLYFDLGYGIYENKLADHHNAVRYLDEARHHRHDQWVPRMLFLAMMRNGQYEDAIEGWVDYIKLFPENLAGPRFLKVNRGYLAEARMEEAMACAKTARAYAQSQADAAEQERLAGNTAKAGKHTATAAKADADALELDRQVAVEKEAALATWNGLKEIDNDPLADARMRRMQAIEYADEGRYFEAVSELEVARWAVSSFFTEGSDMIMDIKQRGGIPLSVSERLAVQRKKEAAQFLMDEEKPKPIVRTECSYGTDMGAVSAKEGSQAPSASGD